MGATRRPLAYPEMTRSPPVGCLVTRSGLRRDGPAPAVGRGLAARCRGSTRPSASLQRGLILFRSLLDPFHGIVNPALGLVGLPQPGWFTDPALALYSIAAVDIWKGVGIDRIIDKAGVAKGSL
jgi:hypothetical protein